MSEEIRQSSRSPAQSGDDPPLDDELQELRAAARALRQKVEQLEEQLRLADEVAAKFGLSASRTNGKRSPFSKRLPTNIVKDRGR